MYLNFQRKELLFKAIIENGEASSDGFNANVFYEKGVAILSSSIGF